MFGKQIRLFKLFGFQVGMDWSWIVIAVLVTWSLASGLFPFLQKGLSVQTYWIMGIIGAVGLFLSIIAHEMFHSLVARRYGMPMKGITLFIFGGVAEMGDEPPSPRAEFMMAIVGPISSILMALLFYGIYGLGHTAWPRPVSGVIYYLSMINGILAAFNLIPAFPLDGGRVLRSILWSAKNDLRRATRISSWIGSAFGIVLIILGVIAFLRGNVIGGMWWFVIGLFLRSAASGSYQQLLIRRALEGEKVRRFMSADPVTVRPSLPIHDLVEHYVYKFHYKMFPVVENGNLLGCITTRRIKEVPREEWDRKTIGELVAGCAANSIEADADAMQALSKMSQTQSSRLMVVENNRLVGVISLKDLLQFISLRVELEDTPVRPENKDPGK